MPDWKRLVSRRLQHLWPDGQVDGSSTDSISAFDPASFTSATAVLLTAAAAACYFPADARAVLIR